MEPDPNRIKVPVGCSQAYPTLWNLPKQAVPYLLCASHGAEVGEDTMVSKSKGGPTIGYSVHLK